MKYLQIWQRQSTKKSFLIFLILFWSILFFYPNGALIAQTKMSMKTKNDTATLRLGDFGSDFPCSRLFGISLEDDRYIFSFMSNMNATCIPTGEYLLPDGTFVDSQGNVIPAPKTDVAHSNYSYRSNTYQAISDKINQIRVGVCNTENDSRWGIIERDVKIHYREDTFDVELDGKARTAFNSEALFYEMLVTIQKLSQDNAALELRLNQIESKMGIENEANLNKGNYLKILTNPINSNTLELEYRIENNIENARILISSTSGKTVQTIAFEKRGVGYEYLILDLPSGLYYCTLVVNDNMLETQKFVVQ